MSRFLSLFLFASVSLLINQNLKAQSPPVENPRELVSALEFAPPPGPIIDSNRIRTTTLLAIDQKGGKEGIIDQNGYPIIDYKYREIKLLPKAKNALHPNFLVKLETNRYGIINIYEQAIVEPEYESLIILDKKVLLGTKKGAKESTFFNMYGEDVLANDDPLVKSIYSPIGDGLWTIKKNEYSNGLALLNQDYEWIVPFSRGQVTYDKKSNTILANRTSVGSFLLETNGNIMWKSDTAYVSKIYPNAYARTVTSSGSVSIINPEGRAFEIPKGYSTDSPNGESFIVKPNANNGMSYMINNKGEKILPEIYHRISFQQSIPVFILQDSLGRSGAMSFEHKIIIPFEYSGIKIENVNSRSNEIEYVLVADDYGQFHLYTMEGTLMCNEKLDGFSFRYRKWPFFVASQKGAYYVYHKDGKKVDGKGFITISADPFTLADKKLKIEYNVLSQGVLFWAVGKDEKKYIIDVRGELYPQATYFQY